MNVSTYAFLVRMKFSNVLIQFSSMLGCLRNLYGHKLWYIEFIQICKVYLDSQVLDNHRTSDSFKSLKSSTMIKLEREIQQIVSQLFNRFYDYLQSVNMIHSIWSLRHLFRSLELTPG
jgi:hypothetical protein